MSMTTVSLHDIAPRLARARDAYEARYAFEQKWQRKQADRIFQTERLVIHRELQLIRAGATRAPAYIRKRQGKLDAARHALASLRAERPPS